MRVCHIVPQLPPVREGIGLYALALADELRRNEGIESVFVAAVPGWKAGEGTPAGAVGLAARTPEALLAAIAAVGPVDRVLLHYVAYGYHPEGLPFWLVRAVEALAARGRAPVIAYHEMWATGPFWKKAFYTAPFQKRIAGALLRHAAAAYTTVGYYHGLLLGLQRPGEEKADPAGPIPGFGMAGDPEARPSEGGLRLLLYGLPFTRRLALRAHRSRLRRWAEAGAVGSVVLMGRAADAAEVAEVAACGIAPDRIELLADLPDAAIRAELARADLYLTGYSACLIGKSTTVLSAMAGGCPVLAVDAREAAPLREGVHFLTPEAFRDGPPTREILAPVGAAGRRWRETEGAPSRIAARIAALLKKGTP